MTILFPIGTHLISLFSPTLNTFHFSFSCMIIFFLICVSSDSLLFHRHVSSFIYLQLPLYIKRNVPSVEQKKCSLAPLLSQLNLRFMELRSIYPQEYDRPLWYVLMYYTFSMSDNFIDHHFNLDFRVRFASLTFWKGLDFASSIGFKLRLTLWFRLGINLHHRHEYGHLAVI
jgi:hypothetical protein